MTGSAREATATNSATNARHSPSPVANSSRHKGECSLLIDGHDEAIRLRAGDCFLLTGKKEFTLARNPSIKRHARAEQLFSQAKNGVAVCQGDCDCFVHGTIFRFEGHLPALLFRRMPPVIVVDGGSEQAAALRWNREWFGSELRGSGVGR